MIGGKESCRTGKRAQFTVHLLGRGPEMSRKSFFSEPRHCLPSLPESMPESIWAPKLSAELTRHMSPIEGIDKNQQKRGAHSLQHRGCCHWREASSFEARPKRRAPQDEGGGGSRTFSDCKTSRAWARQAVRIRIIYAVIPGRGRRRLAARRQVYAGCVNLPALAPRNDRRMPAAAASRATSCVTSLTLPM